MDIRDEITPELKRIVKELSLLNQMKITVGIQGASGFGAKGEDKEGATADLLTIAGVHEFGATIKAKNVRNLAIPIAKKAIGKSPKDFEGLFFIRTEDYLYGCISPNRSGDGPKKPTSPSKKEPDEKKHKDNYKKPEMDDIEFLFILFPSVNIPERSFIRAGYDNSKNELQDTCIKAVERIVLNGWDAETASNYIGMKAVGFIQMYMNTSGNFRKKGKITKETSNWPEKPLIESGRLRNSIIYRIEGSVNE